VISCAIMGNITINTIDLYEMAALHHHYRSGNGIIAHLGVPNVQSPCNNSDRENGTSFSGCDRYSCNSSTNGLTLSLCDATSAGYIGYGKHIKSFSYCS
jgi:hypothetical protein